MISTKKSQQKRIQFLLEITNDQYSKEQHFLLASPGHPLDGMDIGKNPQGFSKMFGDAMMRSQVVAADLSDLERCMQIVAPVFNVKMDDAGEVESVKKGTWAPMISGVLCSMSMSTNCGSTVQPSLKHHHPRPIHLLMPEVDAKLGSIHVLGCHTTPFKCCRLPTYTPCHPATIHSPRHRRSPGRLAQPGGP